MTGAVLGLGLAALGRPAYITADRDRDLGDGAERSVEAMRTRAHAMLDEAWALGIRYLDAARSYGRAEEFLGRWLAAHPERRAELTVSSKWGYEYVGGWRMDADVHERKEHSLAMLDRQWPETIAALGGAPDVYLLHSLTPDSPALGDPALLDRLHELAAGGVRIGFSASGPRQGDVVDAALALPSSPFSAVQATWNLLEPSAGPALRRAHDAGWLVVVKEVLANGRLAGRLAGAGGPGAARPGAGGPGADVALGAALAQPWADVVLTGAVTERQLRDNAAVPPPSPPDPRSSELAALSALAEPAERYWSERSARSWT